MCHKCAFPIPKRQNAVNRDNIKDEKKIVSVSRSAAAAQW